MSQTSNNHQSTMSSTRKTIVPPTRYRLTKLTQLQTLHQIADKTQGFKDLPINFAHWVHWDVYSREFSSFGSILAPPSIPIIKQIIGIDGYYLKLTTQKHGVDFIWHDRTKNEFQFWGEYQRCIRAMNEIRYRICKYVDLEIDQMEPPKLLVVEENDVKPSV